MSYGKGKRSVGICQRGGHKVPYRYIIEEPGTGLRVDRRWSDGRFNMVDHPQNFPPKFNPDEVPLRLATQNDVRTPASVETTVVYIYGVPYTMAKTSASTVCEPILTENGIILMNESSVTIYDCFDQGFYNSYGES